MSREPQTFGFDMNLTTRMRENKNVHDFEHQSLALASDAELIQRGRERSNDNYANTKIMQTQKVQFTATQKKNWLTSQNDKRNRTVKELQFQLASEKLIDLKKLRDNSIHRSSQIEGIAAFEQCMIKNGLESEDDVGLSIGISYENGEAFLRGIEERARKSFPDDTETSKFVTRLKARTKEKRAARIEKERRRRKVANDQSSVDMQIHKSSVSTKSNGPVEDEDDSSGDENSVDLSSSQNNRKELAEESIRVFAEQCRMRHAEGDGPELLLNVLESQRQRAKDKSSATCNMCREVVFSLLNRIDYGEEMNALSIRGPVEISRDSNFPLDLLDRIDSELRSRDSSNFSPSMSFSKDLASHDSWLPFAVLAANIGRWSLTSKSVDAEDILSALLAEDSELEISRESCAVMSKVPLFQESVQTVLEDLLEISCADSTGISLALDAQEQIEFHGSSEGIILVLGGGPGCDLTSADLMRTVDWVGGTEGIELWDVAAAIEAGRALAPLLEGKTPSVTYLALLDIFAFGSASVLASESPCGTVWHEALRTVVLAPKVMKILADISDAASRILCGNKPHPFTSTGGKTEGKGDAAAPTAFFNNVTFGILLGQTLWLRNYLKKIYVDSVASLGKKEEQNVEFEGLSSVGRSPFSPFVIASRCIRADISFAESDHVSFALAVEWFLHGGTKEGLYDTAADSPGRKLLREAVTAESDAMTSGNKKGHEKATSKSKGGGGGGGGSLEADPSGPNLITCIVRMASQGQPASHLHLPVAVLSGPPSKDFADCDKDRVDDILNTATRLIVSNCSNHVLETQRPGTASAVEPASQEHVLIEIAAGANIPYLQLVQSVSTADDTASAPCTAPCPHSIIYSKGLSASETILSIALACKTTHSSGRANGDLKDTRNIRSKVLGIMAQRRERLRVAERLWLLHISASNPLDLLAAHSALRHVQESADFEMELSGACIMAYGLSMSSLEMEFRRREAEMIINLKSSDPRLRDICLKAHEKIFPPPISSQTRFKNTSSDIEKTRALSSEDTSIVVSDCICMLGDVIDLRHIAWIDLAASHRAALEESLASFVEVASSVSRLLADVLCVAHSVKLKSGMLVANLFSAAHHTELPFQLTYSGSRATRRAVEVRKDRLRSASLLLSASCTSVTGSHNSNSNGRSKVAFHTVDQLSSRSGAGEGDLWKDFIHSEESLNCTDLCEGGISLHDSINDELRAEIFESAICVLSALTVGVRAMTEHLEEHNRSVEATIVSRYKYEHTMLKQWTALLHDSLASSGSTGLVGGSFLSSSPFDVCDSDGADEVPYRVNSSAVELEDLTLSLQAVIELSLLLNHVKVVSLSNSLSEESCHEILMKCVGEMDSGLITPAWQQDRKTRSLVNQVLQNCSLESSLGDDLCRVTMTSFVNALVTTLILGSISSPPQTAFILRLGEIFGGKRSGEREGIQFSFQSDKRPHRGVFKGMIRGDNKLRCLWVEGMMIEGKGHTDGDMEHALMALAACCEDSQGLVKVDEVMAMLCHSPPLIRSNTFKRALLLHALTDEDNGVVSACDTSSDVTRLLSLSSYGLCKALAVASRTEEPRTSNDPCSSLTSSKYQWLLECAPAGLPPVASGMFRPRFSLESPTHRACVDLRCADGDGCAEEVEGDAKCFSMVPLSPRIQGSTDDRMCVVLTAARGKVARLVDVAVEVFDTIIKSNSSKVPFCV
jgi:hypothetical protein